MLYCRHKCLLRLTLLVTLLNLCPYFHVFPAFLLWKHTDPMQSTPSIPYTPSPSVPPVPTIDLLPLNNILYPPDAGLEFDQAIQNHGGMDLSISSPLVLNTVDAGPNAGPASYPTPSTHSVNPPAVVNAPQLVRTPVLTSVTTPVGFVDIPRLDAVDKPTTCLSSSVLPLNQAVKALESSHNQWAQQQTQEQIIIRLL
ncbi:conserved serine-proline rich protein [Aspergillus lentulus]|nr:conserved serine-proline rich protein [Aspergillus lentulus]